MGGGKPAGGEEGTAVDVDGRPRAKAGIGGGAEFLCQSDKSFFEGGSLRAFQAVGRAKAQVDIGSVGESREAEIAKIKLIAKRAFFNPRMELGEREAADEINRVVRLMRGLKADQDFLVLGRGVIKRGHAGHHQAACAVRLVAVVHDVHRVHEVGQVLAHRLLRAPKRDRHRRAFGGAGRIKPSGHIAAKAEFWLRLHLLQDFRDQLQVFCQNLFAE